MICDVDEYYRAFSFGAVSSHILQKLKCIIIVKTLKSLLSYLLITY